MSDGPEVFTHSPSDKWDARMLGLAEQIASWSLDPSTKVGAIVVDDMHFPASVGYNGFPRGIADDERLHDRETKYEIVVHAEANALLNSRGNIRGCTLYTYPMMPCMRCAGLVIQAGIKRVVSPFDSNPRWAGDFPKVRALFREAGVLLHEVNYVPVLRDFVLT